jgi:hypothetical protein
LRYYCENNEGQNAETNDYPYNARMLLDWFSEIHVSSHVVAHVYVMIYLLALFLSRRKDLSFALRQTIKLDRKKEI